MAKLTKEDIISSLKEMSMLEINDLVKVIEEEFDVSAAIVVAPVVKAEDDSPSLVTLTIENVGGNKIGGS